MWSIYTDGSTNGGIFIFEKALAQKLLKVPAILSSFFNIELSATKVILLDFALFSVNSGLTYFHKRLIVNNLLIIQIIVVAFFYFTNK